MSIIVCGNGRSMAFHDQSTSWLNMSRGWRKAVKRLVSRGPTQAEAQKAKIERKRRKEQAMLEEQLERMGT